MIRVAPRGLTTALILAVSLSLPAAEVRAQSEEQVDSLISMIRELQSLVAEQAIRISALEDLLPTLAGTAAASTASPLNRAPTPDEISEAGETEQPGRPGWHLVENWWRIRPGMSYEEVVSILGAPTNIRGGYSLRTLQYQGEVPGSGFVRGEVGIYGDANRVFRIQRPEF
jgi:hypothetical protein